MAGRRRRHPVRRVLLSIGLVVVLITVIGLPIYVFPPTDAEGKTDVVMVLGPPNPSRIAIAESMIKRGLSDELVVSVPATGYQGLDEQAVCTEPQTYHVTCFTPKPFTTQGEARELKKLAAQHGWKSATIITFPPHILRAKVLFGRCFSGELRMTADRDHLAASTWVYAYFYQTVAFVKVLANQTC